MSDGCINVGIVGLGRSGWNIHARLLKQLPELFRVVAVLDAKPERRKEAEKELGCSSYTEYRDVLSNKEVELMVVAMPSHLHAPYSIQALEAGKDVVCEKPMATSLADADEMINASKRTGKRLAIFQNRRYSADYLKVKEVMESGKLGRIVMIRICVHGFSRRWDWQTLQEYGGGSLNNTGPHMLDQALQLMGDVEPRVFCHLERTLTSGDADDHVKLILQADGAPMIDLEITSCCAYPRDTWLVMGTNGSLTGSAKKLQWKYVDWSKMPPRPVDREPTPDRSYNREDLIWEPEETWEAAKERGPGQEQFYRDLYCSLWEGKPVPITPESVRKQIAVLEECHRQCPL